MSTVLIFEIYLQERETNKIIQTNVKSHIGTTLEYFVYG